jgi:hypothetical protein
MNEMKIHDPLVLDVNGRKFGLVGSAARGLEGFYERRSNGVLLQDMKGDPFVFIVGNRQAEFFFVSCSKSGEGIRYQHSTTSQDECRLGLDAMGYTARIDLAKKLVLEVRQQGEAMKQPETPFSPDEKALIFKHGCHFAAGATAALEKKPKSLPSYFTKPNGHNAKAWLAGWDFGAEIGAMETGHFSIYGHREFCRVLKRHGVGTIDVQRVSDGRCFRVSGLPLDA